MLLFHEHIYFMPKEKKGEQGTKHTMKLSYLFIERKKKRPKSAKFIVFRNQQHMDSI